MTLLALAVDGRGVVDPAEPVIRADDESLLRGRAAFETLRVYAGRPFRFADHLARLVESARRIALPPLDPGVFEPLARDAVAAAGVEEAVLRLVWTAGPDAAAPRGLALVSPIPAELEELRGRGIAVVSLLGVRAEAPWLLGGVKSTSYAVNMAAEAEAKRRGADDAVFVDADGTVLEGPVTNVWWRAGDTLYTPSVELGILAGVTRSTVLTLAPEHGLAVLEGAYRIDEVARADEAFTSSSVRELMPIVELDGKRVGDGRPGRAARALQSALRLVATDGKDPRRPAAFSAD